MQAVLGERSWASGLERATHSLQFEPRSNFCQARPRTSYFILKMEVGESEIEKCKNDALNSAAKYVANLLQVSFKLYF